MLSKEFEANNTNTQEITPHIVYIFKRNRKQEIFCHYIEVNSKKLC